MRVSRSIRVGAAAFALLVGGASAARASVLSSGDLLITTDFSTSPQTTLYEYTPAGKVVQSWSVPYPGGRQSVEDLRDVAVGADGNIQIYNGTFSPYLTTLNPGTNVFTNHSGDFSSVGNVSHGGVAIAGNYVFVSDENTNGSPNVGVVRFSTSDYSSTRVLSTKESEHVSTGADGMLYVLNGNESVGWPGVEVYNPQTMALVRTIVFTNNDIRNVAATANGTIYAAGWDGTIYKYDPNGNILGTLATGLGNLDDIDLSSTGRIAVVSDDGNVGLTDTALDPLTTFSVTNARFVTFTNPDASPVPEPVGFGAAALAMLALRRPARRV